MRLRGQPFGYRVTAARRRIPTQGQSRDMRRWRCPHGGSVPEPTEDAGEVDAVCLAEPAEGPSGLGSAGIADRVKDASAMLGQGNQGGPPVVRVGPPLHQAPGFHGVDNLSGRSRRDVQMIRKLRQAHRPVAHQHAQSPQVSRGDVPGSQDLLGRVP